MPAFTPKSDKELNEENLWPEAEYDFEVIKADDKKFNTGSLGIALSIRLYDQDGAMRMVNDNLVFTDRAMFKVSQFCKCVGLYEQYKAGRLDAADCQQRSGRLKLGIEPEGEYPAKNKVKTYIVPKEMRKPAQAQAAKVTAPALQANSEPDDCPF